MADLETREVQVIAHKKMSAVACVFDVFEHNGGTEGCVSVPVIKCNANGETFALFVTGTPWSIDLRVTPDFDDADANELVRLIDKKIRASFTRTCPRTNCCGKSQKDAQNFTTSACASNLMMVYKAEGSTTRGHEIFEAFPYNGFQRHKSRFLRVFLAQAYFSSIARREMIEYVKRKEMGVECEVYGFENDTVLQFMDVSARLSSSTPKRETIRCDAWIEFPTTRQTTEKLTRCTHEYEVRFEELKVVSRDVPTPTPRILSFDIETDTDGITFPKPETNAVLSIAIHLKTDREDSILITHGEEAPFNGTFVRTRSERETLNEFRRRLLVFKPDVIAGHNIQRFDISYLHRRAEILCRPDSKLDDLDCRSQKELRRFRDYSWLIEYDVRVFSVVRHKGGKLNKKKKAKPGVADTITYVDCPGVWVCDTLNVAQERESLPDNKLETVAREVLGDHKIDFPITKIRSFFNGTEKMRQLLYMYNMRDSSLVGRLMTKWDVFNACMKEANMFGCLVRHLHVMGKQNKLLRSFRAFGEAQGIAIPKHESVTQSEYDAFEDDPDDAESDENESEADERRQLIPFLLNYKSAVDYDGTYEGAFVFEPNVGFHRDPVVVLDFNSLYPNIMIGNNLCSTVHLKTTRNVLEHPDHLKEICAAHGLKAEDVFVSPNGDVFVRGHVRKGLGPLMMEYMLAKRAEYKGLIKRYKAEKDEAREKNAEASSNSFKIGANSFYGGTGSRLSPFYDPGVSASITKLGQNAIKAMDEYVGGEIGREWTKDGAAFRTRRIYGDTDSLMIRIEASDLVKNNALDAEKAWETLEWLAKQVNTHGHTNNIFPRNMKMGADKVFYPYVIVKKKMYAGVLYELGKKPKSKISGMEKREYPEVLLRTLRTIIDMALHAAEARSIFEYVKMRTSNLLGADLIPEATDDAFQTLVESWDGTEHNLPELPDPGDSLRASDFLVSVKIKAEEDYDNPNGVPQLHAARIWRKEKGVDAAPKPGDRILFGFAIMVDSKTKSATEAARPAYRFESGQDLVDRMYYFENKYKTPLETILTVIIGPELTREVLDPTRYKRLVGATRIPTLFGPRTNAVRPVFQAPSAVKRSYAQPTKNGDISEWWKRVKSEVEAMKAE